MKKLNKYVLAMFVIISLMLTSCSSNEDYYEDNNENTGTEESTGDYWPTAIGYQWNLDQSGNESTMKIVSSQKVNDDTYFKFDQFAGVGSDGGLGTAYVLIKKVKGDYYIKIDDIIYDSEGITGKTTGYEFIFLKDYLEVNKTWSGSFTQETSFNIADFPVIKMNSTYTGTILEKGATAVIKGVTYKDVIKFKIHQVTKAVGTDADPVTVDSEYWVAKDTGLIRFKNGNAVTELVSFTKK